MRTLSSLLLAVITALVSAGCASTSGSASNTSTAMATADTAKPQTLFSARLQPTSGVVTSVLADGRVKVAFPGITAFSHDGARISEEQQRQLLAVAETLKGMSYQKLTVVGHTDSSGVLAYNHKLSQQRAEQVTRFLVQQGLSAEQLNAEGRGPAEPIADNSNAAGRAANRRVELELLF